MHTIDARLASRLTQALYHLTQVEVDFPEGSEAECAAIFQFAAQVQCELSAQLKIQTRPEPVVVIDIDSAGALSVSSTQTVQRVLEATGLLEERWSAGEIELPASCTVIGHSVIQGSNRMDACVQAGVPGLVPAASLAPRTVAPRMMLWEHSVDGLALLSDEPMWLIVRRAGEAVRLSCASVVGLAAGDDMAPPSEPTPPTLVVTLSEGGITNLQSSAAMRVVTLEYGAPDAALYEEAGVDGEDCIVCEHSLSRHVVGGSFAIDPDRVMSVIGQLSASSPA